MSPITSIRMTKTFTHTVPAPPGSVFPLLCPQREYEWIEGWECEMVYSESGVAEKDCVFTKNLPGAGPSVWVVSRYEPDQRIEFVITCPGSHVEKLEIALADLGQEGTRLTWTRIYTSLSEKGAAFLDQAAVPAFEPRMEWLARSMDYFLANGQALAGAQPEKR
ncbi:MAG: SRPBCC family protein [Pseudomonadota bacterium]